MKHKITFLLIAVLIAAQADAKKLSAMFSYCTFYSPVQGPYVETYLSISSASVHYKLNEKKLYQAKVEVMLVLKKNDKIIYYDKYNLLSPEVEDTVKQVTDFLDQQRVKLSDGSYALEITMTDKNAEDKSYSVTENIDVQFPDDKISVSDIEFITSYKAASSENSFSKNGYEMIPFIDNYFGPENKSMIFYAEVYNTDKVLGDNPWLIYYYITRHNKKEIISDLSGFARQLPVALKSYLAEIPVSTLTSGNYELNVEVKSKTNEVLASKKIFFQRNSGNANDDYANREIKIEGTFAAAYTDKDSLMDYMNSLVPVSNATETQYIDNQVARGDVTAMQYFLFLFWSKRNHADPEREWLSYLEEVKKVNAAYGTRIQRGYKTERGRVYLQYGAPNTITKYNTEPNAYPYEIWHYYKLNNQSNKKFVFYNKNSATNDYVLLHSDANGEVYEPRWEMILHQRLNQSGLDWDVEKVPTHPGSHSGSEFNNPK
ncbi:MAG TPA: GWxTD domain-containing protein [Bacteroidia bacterium]|nr:GWxTD domain-containing protein [Bacteroidia bacterium]